MSCYECANENCMHQGAIRNDPQCNSRMNEMEFCQSQLASQQAAHEAEIARLKTAWDSAYKQAMENGTKLSTANERIAYLEGLVAGKDAALKSIYTDIGQQAADHYGMNSEEHYNRCYNIVMQHYPAISATPQQVSEWERKQLEPLRDEIAELKMELDCAKHKVCCEIETLRAAGSDLLDKINQSIPVVEIEKAEQVLREAISATPQQVSEWERKQLEPLRAQVAIHCPMCEDSGKRIAELERKLRVEERFRLNSLTCPAPGHDYWQRWYEARLSVETEELEQRVKVLTDALMNAARFIEHEHGAGFSAQYKVALNKTPQQIAAQIERGHIEWMMKLPIEGYKTPRGAVYGGAHGGKLNTNLVAIPPLPKESDSPETDLDESLRRQ